MGRGSKTHESNVTKERPAYSVISSSSSGTGKSKSRESCLFSVKASVEVSEQEGTGITESSPVVIVSSLSNQDELELYINGRNLGRYSGPSSKKIINCIKENYVYEGSVKKVTKTRDGFNIQFQIQGFGR